MLRAATSKDSREVSAAQLKRCLIISRGCERLRVEPDQTVSYLSSSPLKRLALGRESVELFKVQAGIVVPQRQRETRVNISPGRVEFFSPEPLHAAHSIELLASPAIGYTRTVSLANVSDRPVRLRVLAFHDPTTMSSRREKDPPGEVGVNAFNRGDHVVMDDVGDTTGVRVIGFKPRPTAIYMTKDRRKAEEVLSSGELPDSVAGMSGAILVITGWEFDVSPGASVEVGVTSIYHPSSLETALSELSGVSRTAGVGGPAPSATLRTSSPSTNFAFSWARAALDSIESEESDLDRLASGFAIQILRPVLFEKEFDRYRKSMRKDGTLSVRGSASGVLETALFLAHSSGHLLAKGDKKLSRKWYPTLRKAGLGLCVLAKTGTITTASGEPEGWRRRLGSGYPTGVLAEVNLVASRALNDLAQVAYVLGKGADSASFTESKVKLLEGLNSSLRDSESGNLALNIDPLGRVHRELTVDQVVGLSYIQPDANLASSAVHRLLDPDFETGYGPRTVPSSNALYYSTSYGEGQLGGYWTRAALAHAILAYSSGYPAIGSLQLEKVARMVHYDCEKFAGVPGEFPFWVDTERKSTPAIGSDPVAAARYVEALLLGEVGLQRTPGGRKFAPPKTSKLRWLLLDDLAFGGTGSYFLGRTASEVVSASSYSTVTADGAKKFPHSERILARDPVECVSFWDDSSMLVCLGNTSSTDASGTVVISGKGKPVERALFVDTEEFNPETSTWKKSERKRVPEKLEVRAELKASSWKMVRISQIR